LKIYLIIITIISQLSFSNSIWTRFILAIVLVFFKSADQTLQVVYIVYSLGIIFINILNKIILVETIRNAYKGKSTLSSEASDFLISSLKNPLSTDYQLTSQEKKILAYIIIKIYIYITAGIPCLLLLG